MPGNDGAASLHLVAMRVTQLKADGSHAGQNMYVTQDLARLEFNPDIEAGPEVSDRNAAGNLSVIWKIMDVLKRLTVVVETMKPDPVLETLLTGGTTYLSGSNVEGFQYPPVMVEGNPNGVSIEAWTRAVVNGAQPTDFPYWRWVLPLVKLRKSNRTADTNRMTNSYEGFGFENANWGAGPIGDFTYNSQRVVNVMRDTAIPAATTSVTGAPV